MLNITTEKDATTMLIDGFEAIRQDLRQQHQDMKVVDVAPRLQALRQEIIREAGYDYHMPVLLELFNFYLTPGDSDVQHPN